MGLALVVAEDEVAIAVPGVFFDFRAQPIQITAHGFWLAGPHVQLAAAQRTVGKQAKPHQILLDAVLGVIDLLRRHGPFLRRGTGELPLGLPESLSGLLPNFIRTVQNHQGFWWKIIQQAGHQLWKERRDPLKSVSGKVFLKEEGDLFVGKLCACFP